MHYFMSNDVGARALSYLLLTTLLASCGAPSTSLRVAAGQETSSGRQESGIPERPIPSKGEWVERLLRHPEQEIDLVESATVLASARLNSAQRYSAILQSLQPHLQRARKSLSPGSGPEDKIAALNKEVLPAIQKESKEEFRWLNDTLSGGEGGCAVFTLLYVIAAEALSLRLEIVCLPNHVLPCHITPERRKYIETTHLGEHLSYPEYRKFLSDDLRHPETIAEDTGSLEKHFTPITRRQFVAMLLCQTGGKGEKSLEDMEAAIRIAPEFYYPLKVLASDYLFKKNYSKAEEISTKAIELAPYVPGVFLTRTLARTSSGKRTGAMEDLEAALKLAPHYGAYYHLKAFILLEQEQVRDALEACTLAVENAPTVADFWRLRGRIYGKLRKYKEAIGDFTKAIELTPKDAGIYQERGNMWAMVGVESEYEADRKKARELQSSGPGGRPVDRK